MGKAKKNNLKKGASKKAARAISMTPPHEEHKEENSGIIGIGIPMSEEEMKRLKENAKKLDH
jgi:hypothetical protein